jgi:hypothetical protein
MLMSVKNLDQAHTCRASVSLARQTSAVKQFLRGDQANSSVRTPFWGMLYVREAFSLTKKLTSSS